MVTNKRSNTSAILPVFWWIGFAVGAASSVSVTVVVVIWEWVENPGGIFHGESGTNWPFVFDTAISWFIPTFVYVAIIVSISHLAWAALRRYRGKNRF